MMRDWLTRVFGKPVVVQFCGCKKVGFVEVFASDRVVYGVLFAVVVLVCLVVLEVVYMVVFRSFNSEVFACISFAIGAILGGFFVQRG